MKQALQYQQSIQHMLNVAKKQSTVITTPKVKPVEPTPPPVIVETKPVVEEKTEPIVAKVSTELKPFKKEKAK